MQKKGLFYIPSRGVIAKRLGGGLQNRSDRFDSDSRLHFFCLFFSEIVSNPRKKQILTLANEFARQAFFFLLWSFFAIAKNRITHLFAGCTRFARALRRFAPCRFRFTPPFFLSFFFRNRE